MIAPLKHQRRLDPPMLALLGLAVLGLWGLAECWIVRDVSRSIGAYRSPGTLATAYGFRSVSNVVQRDAFELPWDRPAIPRAEFGGGSITIDGKPAVRYAVTSNGMYRIKWVDGTETVERGLGRIDWDWKRVEAAKGGGLWRRCLIGRCLGHCNRGCITGVQSPVVDRWYSRSWVAATKPLDTAGTSASIQETGDQ